MPIEPGGQIGAYRIESRLGQGGMGTVYRAFDTTLQRPVAIKVLSEADPQARRRLLQEARSASALNHPNVATVHEVSEHDGQPYIVMELVQGKPLGELIPSDGLPPENVIRYGLQIADALAHAHEHGIIHRDLKSQNVVITPEGRAKVLDFGLATRLEQQDAEAVTVSIETEADAGAIAGTLAYMAPEVLRGEAATARCDVWALGVLLHEMAAGQRPFDGASRADVVSAILKESPPPLQTQTSAGLRSTIQRCLAKESTQRYASAAGAQAALEALQSDTGATRPVDRTSPGLASGTAWRAVAALIILAVVLGVGYQLWPRPAVATVLRLANPVRVTSGLGLIDVVSWSPDGATLAYHNRLEDNIWVTEIGGQPLNRTPGFDGLNRFPTWLPGGREIGFFSRRDGGGIFVTSYLTGAPLKVSSAGADPHWLADGTQLAYVVSDDNGYASTSSEVEIVTLATDERRRVLLPGTWRRRFQPSWSPDEQYLAYVDRESNDAFISQLWVYRFADGEAFPVTDARTWNESPSWSPDGRTLYFVSNRGGLRDLWQQRLTADGTPDGESERVTNGIGMWRAQLSPDGRRLAYVRGGRIANVWRVPILADRPATWTDAEQLTFDRAWLYTIDVSADGERLVFDSDRNGNSDVWVMSTDGGEMQQITADLTIDVQPRFSRDGERVVFVGFRSGSRDVWVMPSGGGQATQLTTGEGTENYPAWSPTGTEIVYRVQDADGSSSLWVVDVETRQHRLLSDEGSATPLYSPDGGWIAFWRGRGGATQVWRIPSTGGEAEALTRGSKTRWSPDGRQLYFVRDGSGSAASAWVLSLNDRTERQVMDLSGRPGGMPQDAFDTDGKFLYFGWREDQGDIWVMDVVQDEP